MRAWIAWSLLLVVALGAFNGAKVAERIRPPTRLPQRSAANVVLQQEQRLGPVLAELRQRNIRSPVGYFTDLRPEQMRADPPSMERYFLAQFVLAPWILDASSEQCEWAVADLRAASAAARVPARYAVMRDFGGGVVLLQQKATP